MSNGDESSTVAASEPTRMAKGQVKSARRRQIVEAKGPKGQAAAQGGVARKVAAKGSKRAAGKGRKPAPGGESKSGQILALIGRGKGASLKEIQKATGWQAHSVRGFLSTAGKKRGLKIESRRNEAGERVYQSR